MEHLQQQAKTLFDRLSMTEEEKLVMRARLDDLFRLPRPSSPMQVLLRHIEAKQSVKTLSLWLLFNLPPDATEVNLGVSTRQEKVQHTTFAHANLPEALAWFTHQDDDVEFYTLAFANPHEERRLQSVFFPRISVVLSHDDMVAPSTETAPLVQCLELQSFVV